MNFIFRCKYQIRLYISFITFIFVLPSYAFILYPPPAPRHEGWHVGLQTIYTQNFFNTQTSTTGSDTPQIVPPTWTLGYKTQLAYLFDRDLDLNLNWVSFNSDLNQDTHSNDNLTGQYAVNQFGTGLNKYGNANPSEINDLNTNVDNKINTFNFEFGRTIALNEHVDLRFEMGLQYANIKQNITQTATNTDINSEFNYNSNQINTKFNGVGPRAGLDAYYKLGYGLSLVNSFAFALPTGPSNINSNIEQSNEANTKLGNVITASYGAISTIFDYSEVFSLRYEYPFMESLWGFDVGYQTTGYQIAEQSGIFFGLRVIH